MIDEVSIFAEADFWVGADWFSHLDHSTVCVLGVSLGCGCNDGHGPLCIGRAFDDGVDDVVRSNGLFDSSTLGFLKGSDPR